MIRMISLMIRVVSHNQGGLLIRVASCNQGGLSLMIRVVSLSHDQGGLSLS